MKLKKSQIEKIIKQEIERILEISSVAGGSVAGHSGKGSRKAPPSAPPGWEEYEFDSTCFGIYNKNYKSQSLVHKKGAKKIRRKKIKC